MLKFENYLVALYHCITFVETKEIKIMETTALKGKASKQKYNEITQSRGYINDPLFGYHVDLDGYFAWDNRNGKMRIGTNLSYKELENFFK